MMEKCFVDSVCPPMRIQQAAVEIGHWFADNNIKHWELANCASRDSFEQLRQRVTEKDEVIAEAGEMLAMRDRQLAALKAENESLQSKSAALVDALEKSRIGLVQWHVPENRYSAINAIDAALAAFKGEK